MRKAYPAMTPWLAALLVLVLPTAATAQELRRRVLYDCPWFGEHSWDRHHSPRGAVDISLDQEHETAFPSP